MKINAFNLGVPRSRRTPKKILLIMKLTTFLLIVALTQVSAKTFSQITLKAKHVQITEVLKQIEKQSGFVFLYDYKEINTTKVSLDLKNVSIETALAACFSNLPFTYKMVDDTHTITIKPKEKTFLDKLILNFQMIDVYGKVVDEGGRPLVGASVSVKGNGKSVRTNHKGEFYLANVEEKAVLIISYVGYTSRRVAAVNQLGTITLEVEAGKLKEVTINTGLFSRKSDSFTGAVSAFSGAELKRVGNVNLLQSLAVLDPSFVIADNLDFGSDPNRIPEVTIRGASGIPDLNATYANAPNLPLFILDGFETTVQRIYDLNMNMVARVTLLKDASAKAIYGSKAGNGVVVIETVRPAPGNLRVSYTGSLDFTAPDLSSYNMTNSMQKVEAELLGGKYTSNYPELQYPLTQQYTENKRLALAGLDNYWLSKPLQNGIGQKQNLMIDGGTEAMRYSAGVSYNNQVGTMKGSDRTNISGNVNLQYHKNNFSFTNSLTIDQNKGVNSPYGDFGTYTRLNPYWRSYDDSGKIIPYYEVGSTKVYNPLFDASLNTKDNTKYTNITENFYGEWEARRNLRFTARVGITNQKNSSELFLPASHSSFANIPVTSTEYLNRGQYTIGNGSSNMLSSDVGAAYSFMLSKHQVFANLLYSVQQSSMSSNGMTMVGFPNDKLDDISMGRAYATGSRASGLENTDRNMGVTSAVNYSYDNRFLADFSFRANASSQFGANKRWGNFWSTGLGWNLHNEPFMKSVSFVNILKLRGSVGSSGTQNFNSYQAIAAYKYITDATYNGDLGVQLLALVNPDLKWQQAMDKNIGIDASLLKIINLRADYYIKDTKDLLSDQTVVPSTGFAAYKENIGETRNSGYQVNATARLYTNDNRVYVSIFGNVAHNTNKIRKVSNALKKLNDNQDATLSTTNSNRPITRFAEGQSITAIWGVPSKGIDPATGREIFVKKDGSVTYLWSAADQVVIGDATPKFMGSFGSNIQIHGFTINFAFSYRLGGQLYNSTLVNKVEDADINYNVDVRFLEDRWKTPGQYSLFKNIADSSPTKPTSRFSQDNSELIFSSVNLGYDFSKMKFLKQMKMSSLTATLNANDLGRIGTVKTERGLDYPFARTLSLSLQASF